MGMGFFEDKERSLELKKTNHVQMLLALRAYRETHPDEIKDINDPRAHSHETQFNALKEWSKRYSERFNEHMKENPRSILDIDVHNSEALDKLFEDIRHPKDKEASTSEGTLGDIDRKMGGMEI